MAPWMAEHGGAVSRLYKDDGLADLLPKQDFVRDHLDLRELVRAFYFVLLYLFQSQLLLHVELVRLPDDPTRERLQGVVEGGGEQEHLILCSAPPSNLLAFRGFLLVRTTTLGWDLPDGGGCSSRFPPRLSGCLRYEPDLLRDSQGGDHVAANPCTEMSNRGEMEGKRGEINSEPRPADGRPRRRRVSSSPWCPASSP